MAKTAAERMREMRKRKRLERQMAGEDVRAGSGAKRIRRDIKRVAAEAVAIESEVQERGDERWEAFEVGQVALRFVDAHRTDDRAALGRIRTWLRDEPRPLLWMAFDWLSRQGLGDAWASFVEEAERT